VFDRLVGLSVERIEAREKRVKRVKMTVMSLSQDFIVMGLHKQREGE
jgi:archaellum component FlaC